MTDGTRREVLQAGGIASGLFVLGVAATPTVAQTPPVLRMRRNASLMASSDSFFVDYGNAVNEMHRLDREAPDDRRGWKHQARMHLDFCHRPGASFLPWHRVYLRYFEEICGELIGKPDFALAFFDWTVDRGKLPDPFFDNDYLNVEYWDDDSGAVWGGRVTNGSRGLSKGQGLADNLVTGGVFRATSINQIKGLSRYDQFENAIEGGPHNTAHGIIGGSSGHMSNAMSPLDPIFWLHHCNVDRIWAEWQQANVDDIPAETYNGMFVDRLGENVTVTSASAANINTEDDNGDLQGYDYVTIERIAEFDVAGSIESGRSLKSITSTVIATSEDGLARFNRPESFIIEFDELETAVESTSAFSAGAKRRELSDLSKTRILAEFRDVKPSDTGTKLIVNVFVNCPYISANTNFIDQHYAGSFSFFGGVHHNTKGKNYVVDLTETLGVLAASGRLNPDEIEIQVVPVAAEKGMNVANAQIEIGSISIIST